MSNSSITYFTSSLFTTALSAISAPYGRIGSGGHTIGGDLNIAKQISSAQISGSAGLTAPIISFLSLPTNGKLTPLITTSSTGLSPRSVTLLCTVVGSCLAVGTMISEFAIFDSNDNLIAVKNFPPVTWAGVNMDFSITITF